MRQTTDAVAIRSRLDEHLFEPGMNRRRHCAVLEETLDQRVFLTHLFDVLLLNIDDLFEVVVLDELENAVGRQKVGRGDSVLGVHTPFIFGLLQD